MPNKVNYDQLAPTYNQRFEAEDARKGTGGALLSLARALQAEAVLEVGCGTGHWLSLLRSDLEAGTRLYGVDLSRGMLEQARQHAGLLLTQGPAERLPLPPGRLDLVYCVNAIHHFTDAQAFICEALGLLRPGGALAVAGMNPLCPGNQWFVYDYFEGVLATDLERFPTWGTVLDWMSAAGVTRARLETVEVIDDRIEGRAVLEHPFLRKHSCSQLALLSDEAYAAGLDRIRADLDQADRRQEVLRFKNRICIDMLVGWK